jgi:hypothetical protein
MRETPTTNAGDEDAVPSGGGGVRLLGPFLEQPKEVIERIATGPLTNRPRPRSPSVTFRSVAPSWELALMPPI